MRGLNSPGSDLVVFDGYLAWLETEEDPGACAETFRALGKLGWEGPVPRLELEIQQAREDPQQWIYPQQFNILVELAALSNQSAVHALERVADRDLEGDLYLQYRAGRALGQIPDLTILLPKQIEDPDLDAAYEFTGRAEEAGNTLIREQETTLDAGSNPAQSTGQVQTLGTILAVTAHISVLTNGPKNSHYLIRIYETDAERCFAYLSDLQSEDSALRASIVKAIGSCGPLRAGEALIDCLQNESSVMVLYEAVRALARIGDKAAVPHLRRLLDPGAFPGVDLSWHAAEALSQIDPADPETVAAYIDFGMPDTVSRAFRNLDRAVFCVESDRIPERFQGASVLTHPLESDPSFSCVLIERTFLHLGHPLA